jgi:hypothetical protein
VNGGKHPWVSFDFRDEDLGSETYGCCFDSLSV